ncbi:MAG: TonB-dependent receptor [Gammaproteobacteria bacterium]|nr:TonB-dependent receptor [Gammaproteobacteria bacterium]
MKHSIRALLAYLPTAVLIALASLGAMAAEKVIEEEIIVTASFHGTALMDEPGSVTVLSGGSVADRAARHVEELLGLAPNVGWSTGASRSRFVQVRGIGDLEQYSEPKYYPAVGLTVDGLEVGSAANAATLFDVAQVEVLRGPQGTRFGASAHAGLINIRTHEPTETFEGALSAGVGNRGARHWGGILSGPLGEALQGRIAIQRNVGDGHFQNAALDRDDLAGFDERTARAKLRWRPNERSRYGLNLMAFDSDNGYDVWSLDNDRTTQSDEPGIDRQEVLGLNLTGDWQLNDRYSLRALASRSDADLLHSYDVDWISPDFCVAFTCSFGHDTATESFDRSQDQTSVELRLLGGGRSLDAGQWQQVAGLYFKATNEELRYAYPSAWYGDYAVATDYETSHAAAYGELEFGLSDRLSFSLGARLEAFEDDYGDSNGVTHDNSETLLSAELRTKYRLGNGGLLYASVAAAEKPGGVNVSASSQLALMSTAFQNFMASKIRFGSERLVNKEVGYKTVALASRLSVRAAAFHTARSNAQLESWMWDDAAGLWIGYLDSTSDGENYGVELESLLEVTPRLQAFANLAILRTEVDDLMTFDLDAFEFQSRSGRDQAKSPRLQYAAGLNATLSANLSASVNVEGRGGSFYGYYHDGRLGGYDLVNANVRWTTERFSLNIWARNLADEKYATHGLYFGADPRDDFGFWSNRTYEQRGAPRSFGVDAELRL